MILLEKKILALIAHDGKKLDMALLVVQYFDVISRFDYIIATGTTGGWIQKFLEATSSHIPGYDVSEVSKKVIKCRSGPYGGDVQISRVCIEGYCKDVIFLIDPMESHPHEPDIRFFTEILDFLEDKITIATNLNTAQILLKSIRSGD